jgi:membrane-associated protease RseP (regulator of RpoE activity)
MIVSASLVLVQGQTDDAKAVVAKPTRPSIQIRANGSSDLPFSHGIDLQFLIKELAREMDLNVIFDVESFRSAGRKTNIDLKNVSAADALNYILLQERLYAEEIGPKTIVVASQSIVSSPITYFGVSIMPLSKQLAEYFGVKSGILITSVREESPGWKAGLKAGDVITTIDGEVFWGALSLIRTLKDDNRSEITLKVVRDKQELTISLTRDNGIK